MNVQEMTDRLKVRYKRITPATKIIWDKAIRYIKDLDVADVTDEVAADYWSGQRTTGVKAQSNVALVFSKASGIRQGGRNYIKGTTLGLTWMTALR